MIEPASPETTYVETLFCTDAVPEMIAKECAKADLPNLSISPQEGRFLQILVAATGAIRVLEFGSLGGYSASWLGNGMKHNGKLITVEIDPARANLTRSNLTLARFQYEVFEGDGHKLKPVLARHAPFDFVFIDAEKEGYPDYFDFAMNHTRSGGIVAAHNAFMYHTVAYENAAEPRTNTMRHFNRLAAMTMNFLGTIYPAGDGILFGVVL